MWGRIASATVAAAIFGVGGAHAQTAGRTYELPATPTTIAWGNSDPTHAPALTIHSGDTVVFHTLLTNSPTGLERAGLAPDQVEAALREVYAKVTDRGPGGH